MKRWWMLGLGMALLVTACGGSTTGTTNAPPTRSVVPATTTTIAPIAEAAAVDALAAARDLWSAAPSDYTVTKTETCDSCNNEPQTLAVHDGEVVSLTSAEASTIEDVFDTIESSIAQGADVNVEYDGEFGFPTRVVIDLDGDGEHDIDLTFDDLEAMPIVTSLEELLAARELWDAANLGAYRYIFRADCTCPESGTWQVTVENGSSDVVPLDDAAAASQLSPGDLEGAFEDLEEWFTASEELIDEGILAVDVRMDPVLGYPRWFSIKGADIDDAAFDEPFTLIVTVDLVEWTAGDGEPEPPAPDDDVVVEAAASRWLRAELRDYRLVFVRHCECPAEVGGPFVVEVENGRVIAVTRQSDGGSVDQSEALTVDAAFETIRAAISARVDVAAEYHDILGYPTFVVIDPEAAAVDGGFVFTISDVEPLGRIGLVIGRVTAGPQCPVQSDPPQPGCEDQPVPQAPAVVNEVGSDEVIVVPVGDDGTFVLRMQPGNYVIEPQPVAGFLGTPQPVDISVIAGGTHRADLMYDTGIR